MAARVLKERPSIRDERWYYLALACWVGAQFAAVAYGRVAGALDSRYYDIYLVGLLVGGASLFRMMFSEAPRAARTILVYAAVWLIALFWGAGQKAMDHLPAELAWRRDTAVIQTENFRRYLTTGDVTALHGKPTVPHSASLARAADRTGLRPGHPGDPAEKPVRAKRPQPVQPRDAALWPDVLSARARASHDRVDRRLSARPADPVARVATCSPLRLHAISPPRWPAACSSCWAPSSG